MTRDSRQYPRDFSDQAIAALAGVPASSVAAFYSGLPIRPETRQKVEAALERLRWRTPARRARA
jgi:DNA-binding LacI/PurR family transcriptional regulator